MKIIKKTPLWIIPLTIGIVTFLNNANISIASDMGWYLDSAVNLFKGHGYMNMERSLILNPDGPLAFDHLNLTSPIQGSVISDQDREPAKLDEVVSQHIQRVLAIADGKIHGPGGAAELLGLNPSTLRNRMNKLGIGYGRGNKDAATS